MRNWCAIAQDRTNCTDKREFGDQTCETTVNSYNEFQSNHKGENMATQDIDTLTRQSAEPLAHMQA